MCRPLLLCALLLAACGGRNPGGPGAPDSGAIDGAPDASEPTTDAPAPDAPTADASMPPDGGAPPDGGEPPHGMVQCPTPVPAPTAGTCDATAGTGTAVVVRGNLLGDGVTYLDGELLYDGDRLVCVGCDCSAAPGYATATRVSCGGAAVSPGLINAHDHLNYDNKWPLASTAAGGARFEHRHGWRALNNTPGQSETGADSAGMRWNELRQAMAGTTSIAASTKADGMMRNLDELEGRDRSLGLLPVIFEVFALSDGNRTYHPNCTWNYKYSELQVALMHGIVTHTSEGINGYAHDEFLCQSASTGGARDFTEKNVAHIHGVGLTARDYYAMARDHAKLVWSPRSNISLYGNTAQPQIFARLGGVIALGTDWTYSGSATLPREMACAAAFGHDYLGNPFADEDIWRMATINGAIATGNGAEIGSLVPGKLADIAVFRAAPGELHRAVIDSTTADVALVVRDGDVLFGETDVVTALGQTCDPVDVCGDERRVCASREFGGATYASIATHMNPGPTSAYPAVFCDAPPSEPTCTPTRPNAYGGITAEDPDGDGIGDGDNCPTVFNPIRPMDMGAQPDADGDGVGDACDPTPIGDDLDGDGRGNAADGCPLVSDPGTDTDGDGKGDACDACPDVANPDSVCMPPATTITAIQTTVMANTPVLVQDAIVTAIDGDGFHAQDPTVADGRNAGVYVYLNERPQLHIGDRVTFAGTTTEYFNLTEVKNAGIVASGPGTPIAPVALTSAAAADEAYEGTLVTITDAAQVDHTYDCSADAAACHDARLWRLDGSILVWDTAWQGTTAEWTSENTAAGPGTDVTGVMYFRYERRRILPRTAADITP